MIEREVPDYYEMYSGPDVFRQNLLRDPNFTLEIAKGNAINVELTSIPQGEFHEFTTDEESIAWMYVVNGNGVVTTESETELASNEDLFYVRRGSNSKITADEDLQVLTLTRTTNIAKVKGPSITKLPPRSEDRSKHPVDWVGSWIQSIPDAREHVAREGMNSSDPENPRAELPLHKHAQTVEVYFIADGRSIIMLNEDGKEERMPWGSGDLIVVNPHVEHGAGNPKLNNGKGRTYSGAPFRGIVFKIPVEPEATADRNDKFYNK